MKIPLKLKINRCSSISRINSKGLVSKSSIKQNRINRLLCLLNEKRKYDIINPYAFYKSKYTPNDFLKYTEALLLLIKMNKIYSLNVFNKINKSYQNVFVLTYDLNNVNPYIIQYLEMTNTYRKKLRNKNIYDYVRAKALGINEKVIRGIYLFLYIIRKDYPQQLRDFIEEKEKKLKRRELENIKDFENTTVKRISRYLKEYDDFAKFDQHYLNIKLLGDDEYKRLIDTSKFKSFMRKEKHKAKKFKMNPLDAIEPEILNDIPKSFFTKYEKLLKKYK